MNRCVACPVPVGGDCHLSCEYMRAHPPAARPVPLEELGPIQGMLRRSAPPDASAVLEQMAATFRERNAEYKNNYKMVGPIMAVLFPQGVSVELLGSDSFHLFELIVIKITRLAMSGLEHEDSVRDIGVYAAMIDVVISEQQKGEVP